MSKEYQFSLQDFFCEEIRFQRIPTIQNAENVEISPSINVNHNLAENVMTVGLRVEISQLGLPFSLAVAMVGRFVFADSEIDADKLVRIARINCASILFPFAREVVADVTRRGGFPSLLLPPINFVEAINTTK